ncbi:MAG: hypothetical protein OSJ27_00525 [Candidatus Gastranaerophilales bacterium]|nr:hypothetical protein [Candidatus Gastranaerophilales bacterium]
MHADEIKNRIEREQKLINTAMKKIAKLVKDVQKSKNYVEYLEDTKKAKRMI